MRIGIDISQLAYKGTGVEKYLLGFVKSLLKIDSKNEYVLFFSSFRGKFQVSSLGFAKKVGVKNWQRVKTIRFRIPPLILDVLWNRLHIVPIEWLIGKVDIFISSDWTQPPTSSAKKATILYDLIVCKHPKETDEKIVATQKRRLDWVKKEADIIFCISEASKKDAVEILGVEEKRLKVIYPGI